MTCKMEESMSIATEIPSVSIQIIILKLYIFLIYAVMYRIQGPKHIIVFATNQSSCCQTCGNSTKRKGEGGGRARMLLHFHFYFSLKKRHLFYIIFIGVQLLYNIGQFLLYSEVNQLYACICPLFFGFPSHLYHHGALSIVLYAAQQVLFSCLINTWYQSCVLSHVQLFCNPMDCTSPSSSVMRFPRQEYCSGLCSLLLGNVPNAGIKPESYVS